VLEIAGLHCEICGAEDHPLQAHEVWSYIDAFDAPKLDFEWVEATIASYKSNEQKRLDSDFAKLNEIAPGKVHICTNEIHSVECRVPPAARAMICNDFDLERRLFPKIAVLNQIQALCRLCHLCKHYRCDATKLSQLSSGGLTVMNHWCRMNRRKERDFLDYYREERSKLKSSLVVKIDYAGYTESPAFSFSNPA
jgi:hypothetical protein